MLLGFGVVLGLTLFIIGAAVHVSSRQRELNGRVEHTHEVQIHLQHTLALLTKVDARESNFLLSGKIPPENSRADRSSEIEPAIASLQRLTADNPVQQANIIRLRALIRAREEAVAQPMRLTRLVPSKTAYPSVALTEFEADTDRIEQAIAAMGQVEDRLVRQRSEAVESYQQDSNRLLIFLRVLVLFSLVSACFAIRAAHGKTIKTLESITDAFFALDSRWNFTYVNQQAEIIMERKRKELLGRNIWQVFPGAEGTVFAQQYRRALKDNVTVRFEEYYAPLNRWFEITAYPSGGGLSACFRDTTERMAAGLEKKRAEEALRDAGERLRLATESGEIGVWELNIAANTLAWDARMCMLYGCPDKSFPGAYEAWTEMIHADDRARTEDELHEAIRGGRKFDTVFRIVRPDGLIRFIKASATVLRDQHNTPIRMIGLNQDVTERKMTEEAMHQVRERLEEANRQLTALATTDGLTGLKNHRAFQEKLNGEFDRTQRYKSPTSLILLDVDNFKTYNDTFGHPEGDLVLKGVAQALRQAARETDYVCRYGGEEFVVILPDTDARGAIDASERLRMAIEAYPWTLRPVTASLGIATLSADLTTAQDLIAQADNALYDSKERGRNRITHFDEIALRETADELKGNVSLPFSDIVREMLQLQRDTLTSASEQVRDKLAQAYDATILGWSRLLDMKDKETDGHGMRVTQLMTALARSVGMNEEEVLYARWGALLHDVGKMGVPDSILHKAETLSEEEWDIIRQHVNTSYEMLSPVDFLRPALDIPYCHHEKWDGTGYPRGLKGDEIPLSARLFAVIDVYDAIRSDRPYRKAWTTQSTVAHLRSLSGTHFDPRAVQAFLRMLAANKPAQTEKPYAVRETVLSQDARQD